jgi:hypothetical protein
MKRTILQSRAVKLIRNAAISMLVLLILVVGAGVAYTWYMGQTDIENTSAVAEPVEYEPVKVVEPPKPAPNAKVGASVQTLTSPVKPGDNTSLTVKSTPGASCVITVVYDKTPSTDSGLKPQVADGFGIATWAWTVEPSAPLGTWPMKVTCTYLEQSAVVQADLSIAHPVEQ